MTRARWSVFCVSLLGMAALAAMWHYSPLSTWTDVARAASWAQRAGASPWVPFVVLIAYTPAALTLFPRPIITLFAVAAFGPWLGFACAIAGIMLAALATYALGVGFDRPVARLLGPRLERIAGFMQRRGVLAVLALRMVPLAPFAVVNAGAGALRIRLRHFAAGTALGILPGTATATILGGEILQALRAPASFDLPFVLVALCLVCGATYVVRRWLLSRWTAR